MGIDYNKLTEGQLEEFVEFIDWHMIPDHWITEEVKRKFKDIPELQVRIWFEELLGSLVAKVDEDRFPGRVFFFRGEEVYMRIIEGNLIEKNFLFCSFKKIWLSFWNRTKLGDDEIKNFIKNVVNVWLNRKRKLLIPFSNEERYFIEMDPEPESFPDEENSIVENYFKQEHENRIR